jgi:hypothetical protein
VERVLHAMKGGTSVFNDLVELCERLLAGAIGEDILLVGSGGVEMVEDTPALGHEGGGIDLCASGNSEREEYTGDRGMDPRIEHRRPEQNAQPAVDIRLAQSSTVGGNERQHNNTRQAE